MTIFLESPVPALALGVVLGTIAAIMFFSRRSAGPLAALAAIVAATIGLVLLERAVETDREHVVAAVRGVAAAVEANDETGVLARIDPAAVGVRNDAQRLLDLIHVAQANASRTIEVQLDAAAAPPTATARFRGFLDGTLRRGGARIAYFDEIELNWIRRGDAWRITDYVAYDKGRPINH